MNLLTLCQFSTYNPVCWHHRKQLTLANVCNHNSYDYNMTLICKRTNIDEEKTILPAVSLLTFSAAVMGILDVCETRCCQSPTVTAAFNDIQYQDADNNEHNPSL